MANLQAKFAKELIAIREGNIHKKFINQAVEVKTAYEFFKLKGFYRFKRIKTKYFFNFRN